MCVCVCVCVCVWLPKKASNLKPIVNKTSSKQIFKNVIKLQGIWYIVCVCVIILFALVIFFMAVFECFCRLPKLWDVLQNEHERNFICQTIDRDRFLQILR